MHSLYLSSCEGASASDHASGLGMAKPWLCRRHASRSARMARGREGDWLSPSPTTPHGTEPRPPQRTHSHHVSIRLACVHVSGCVAGRCVAARGERVGRLALRAAPCSPASPRGEAPGWHSVSAGSSSSCAPACALLCVLNTLYCARAHTRHAQHTTHEVARVARATGRAHCCPRVRPRPWRCVCVCARQASGAGGWLRGGWRGREGGVVRLTCRTGMVRLQARGWSTKLACAHAGVAVLLGNGGAHSACTARHGVSDAARARAVRGGRGPKPSTHGELHVWHVVVHPQAHHDGLEPLEPARGGGGEVGHPRVTGQEAP